MHIAKFLIALPLLIVTVVNAQESPSVSVGKDRTNLLLKFDLPKAIPNSEIIKLKNISNYELHEKINPEDLAAFATSEINRINALPDETKEERQEKKRELDSLASRITHPPGNLINGVPPECALDCSRITLQLTSRLDYDKTYVLTIAGVVLESNPVKPAEFKIEQKAEIAEALNASNTRKELRIRSTGPLSVPSGTLNIEEKTLRISADGTHVDEHPDTLTGTASQPDKVYNLLEVKLDKKLNAGRAHTLLIPASALDDGTSMPISAKGTITIPGLPSPPDDPKLSFEIATNAAVNQKPQFDFDFAWIEYDKFRKKKWKLGPELKADLGLGDTKSDNAISFALLASHSSKTSSMGKRPPKVQPQSAGDRKST